MPEYAKFTEDMIKTHTILVPDMLPIHFKLLMGIFEACGYKMELLQNDSRAVVDEGLKNVHNDACYPALLVIGQFMDALNSGKYDPDKTALLITQTGGGCRASNYIHLLRKAVDKNYPQIPVVSLNFSGLEKDSA
ncbi:MAG: 2-hydroxyacyl-CoA dehydratase, partial [Ruminococcus sp.]|nr:2-hydroxyacyl-CoA dehydratase [Ruminococcus sp.]